MKKQILTTSIILLFSIQIIAQKAYDEVKYTGNIQNKNIVYLYGDGYIDASKMFVNNKNFKRDWNYESKNTDYIIQKFIDGNTYCLVYLDTIFLEEEMESIKASYVTGGKTKDFTLTKHTVEKSDYKTADKELNKVYKEILKKYKNDSEFLAKLKISQRLWIKFRDAELEMRFPEADKRLMYGSAYIGCSDKILAEITVQRTNTLKKWLEGVDEYDVCNGSKK